MVRGGDGQMRGEGREGGRESATLTGVVFMSPLE